MKNRKFAAPLALLALSACSSGLDGTYADDTGVVELKFESTGKAFYMSNGELIAEADYKIDGQRVTLLQPDGNVVFTMRKDGSLDGAVGVLTRKK